MKLDRLFLLIISTMGTVSVGIPIRSSQLGEDVSCRCCVPDGISSDSGGGGLAIREDQPDNKDLFQLVARRESITRDILNASTKTPSGVQKRQRRSVSKRATKPPHDPYDDLSPWDKRRDPGYPTEEEMRLYLSEKEMETYIADWRAGKEFKAMLRQISKGYKLTAEEEELFSARRRSYNKTRAKERYVQEQLVRTNRARPGLLRAYQKYVNALPQAKRVKDRERKSQLETLIADDQASPEEVEEYERLLAKPKEIYKAARERELKQENRLKELESLIEKGDASNARLAEYEALKAKLERREQAAKDVRAKVYVTAKVREKDLKEKIRNEVATEAERAEYVAIRARKERQNELAREGRAKESARLKELKSKKRDNVLTKAELAEYNKITAKRRRKQELKHQSIERTEAARSQGTASTETSSEGAVDQSNTGQSSNANNKPLPAKINSFFNQLDRILQTPRAQNKPWGQPPVPQAVPRLPFRFGIVP